MCVRLLSNGGIGPGSDDCPASWGGSLLVGSVVLSNKLYLYSMVGHGVLFVSMLCVCMHVCVYVCMLWTQELTCSKILVLKCEPRC